MLKHVADPTQQAFRSWLQIITNSGITAGSITAVALNLLFNGWKADEPVGEEMAETVPVPE